MINKEQLEPIKAEISKLLENSSIKDNILYTKTMRHRLSKAITSFAFRNGPIEDMHADESKNITDEDMMILNKYMVDHIELILEAIAENKFIDLFIFSSLSDLYCSDWDAPNPDKYRDSYNSTLDFCLMLGLGASNNTFKDINK